jgi:PIN domain nuclease of toxin-antitoxin system
MGGFVLIILDTHIWIWLNATPELLNAGIAEKLQREGIEIGISAISVWEVVLAAQKGRIEVVLSPERTVEAWIQANQITVIPVDEEIAVLSRTLPFGHEDPADRFIAATAFRENCPLITTDKHLKRLSWLKVV